MGTARITGFDDNAMTILSNSKKRHNSPIIAKLQRSARRTCRGIPTLPPDAWRVSANELRGRVAERLCRRVACAFLQPPRVVLRGGLGIRLLARLAQAITISGP
jgi:hypothetical protein